MDKGAHKKTIVLTGGGSAGHVTANLAIIPKLRAAGWDIEYIGSKMGIEKQIIQDFGGVPYHSISTGKLRRYFDLKNLQDPFKVIGGILQSYRLLRKLKPQIVFSKGGFVAVPVILGSWLNKIPVVIHESDMSPGLANKISIPFATKVCVTFPETMKSISTDKAVHTGTPIREQVLKGSKRNGLEFCGFHSLKPVLFIMGGSLGSQTINRAVRENLDLLLSRFQIVHICGKGNIDSRYSHLTNYKQFEYVSSELPHLFSIADIVVSRAGSNSIFEFLALKKPMLLIPLSREASRGDQILNARSFEKMGYARVLYEEDLTKASLYKSICDVYEQREQYVSRMSKSPLKDSIETIIHLIDEVSAP
jgi:UDP-N-acetylglucosamine--N-acetylmuramyl-(pentapeptide) pyrophosphoryl-undecaprenol N-acetylglucosamine transferase